MKNYRKFKRDIIENQFTYEFNISKSELRNKDNIFSDNIPDENFRFWSSFAGNIVIYNEKLLFRLENEEAILDIKNIFKDCDGEWFFEEENLKLLENILNKYNLTIINKAPFFVPKDDLIFENNKNLKIYEKNDIEKLKDIKNMDYLFSFEKGLYEDKLGLGYIENDELIAMAASNSMSKTMWEISIMKFQEDNRFKGIGAKLVKNIGSLIIDKNILPVYSTQFSHINSMNLAINGGFKLEWVEIIIDEKESK